MTIDQGVSMPTFGQQEDTSSDLATALTALDDAEPAYQTATSYYGGAAPEVFATIRMRRALAKTGVHWKFNFAKTPVDAVADRLEIAAVTAATPAATAEVQDFWADNALDLEAPRIMRRACEFGDAYVIVWPSEPVDPDGNGDVDVDIYYNSPNTVRVFYDPANPLRKSYAVKRWQLNSGAWRVDLYYADRIEKYQTKPGAKGCKAGDLVFYVDEEGDEWPYANPFGAIPVFHFRTDRPYGEPLHKGFYGPQDAINKLIVSHLSSVDYQTFPQRYALMAAEADTSEAADVDDDWGSFPTDTGGTAHTGSDSRSQLTSDPGSLWMLRGMQGVGQFDAANPAVFTDPMATYLRFGAQITTTPIHYFDPQGDAPSGESLRTAEAPFVKKVRNLALSFGATWRELFEFALSIIGIDATVDIRWAPIASVDDETAWTTAVTKVQVGVPRRQVLMEAGYTAEQIDQWGEDAEAEPWAPPKASS